MHKLVRKIRLPFFPDTKPYPKPYFSDFNFPTLRDVGKNKEMAGLPAISS